jgi:hypothetical protein
VQRREGRIGEGNGNGAHKKDINDNKNSAEIETKQRSETTTVQCVEAAEQS